MEDKPEIMAVELHPHSPAWAGMAKAEAARLKAALGDTLITVHHIGSTSIPNIKAKPIVDMIPEVTDIAELDAKEDAIRNLGYRWHGEFGISGRRYCTLLDANTGKRTFQLHCYAKGAPEMPRHLAFRDYLLAHPGIAKGYEAEKIRAASVRSDDVNAYNDQKNDWIQRVQADAMAWWKVRPSGLA
jgi:GrpB-like predicted nucleotidyltransferase (UPF0157 family)